MLATSQTATAMTATLSEQLRERIVAVSNRASEADRRSLASLIAEAKKGEFSVAIHAITPQMAALIFLHHNPHNRDWSPIWSEELARRQTGGQWRKNNATLGFYSDGVLADGQNRCASAALSSYTLTLGIVFGLDRDAITTIDNSRQRHASDAAKLAGIKDSKRKEALVRTVASYIARAGDKTSKLRSEFEIAQAIEADNVLLEDAIEIGVTSHENVVTPQLKDAQAQSVAYLMLKGGWPVQRIREKLALFQSGVSKDGENAPFFVAGEVLAKAREGKAKRDKLSSIKELGVVMYAMVQTEKGVNAVQKQKFKDAVKKDLPSPIYPGDSFAEAA